jgi:hypothetical protein
MGEKSPLLAGNKLVTRVCELKDGFMFDSGWIKLWGWDFPEAAYIASLANSKRYICSHDCKGWQHPQLGLPQASVRRTTVRQRQ